MSEDVSVQVYMWAFPSAKTVHVGRGCFCAMRTVRSHCPGQPSRVSSWPHGEDAVASVDLAYTLRHILWGFSIAPQLVTSQSLPTGSLLRPMLKVTGTLLT